MATKPKPYFSTIDQVVREFVGIPPTSGTWRTRDREISRDLHVVVGTDGFTWMSNGYWIARYAYHPGLQLLTKKYPELVSPGRWQLVRVGGKWQAETIGEAATQIPGYLDSALDNAQRLVHGVVLRQKIEQFGRFPATVEFTYQSGQKVWPVESADIHRSQYGYLPGLFAHALQQSAEKNYFMMNDMQNEYVLNQGWTVPFEVSGSGLHMLAHWHNLHVTAQSTVHGVKSGNTRIVDGFLVEHRPEVLPS